MEIPLICPKEGCNREIFLNKVNTIEESTSNGMGIRRKLQKDQLKKVQPLLDIFLRKRFVILISHLQQLFVKKQLLVKKQLMQMQKLLKMQCQIMSECDNNTENVELYYIGVVPGNMGDDIFSLFPFQLLPELENVVFSGKAIQSYKLYEK